MTTNTIKIGGPTFFAQAPSGLWGEFRLPPGKRIENGDSFSIYDCEFLGVLYKEINLPPRPADPNDEQQKSEWRAQRDQFMAMSESDKCRTTLASSGFVFLYPLSDTDHV